MPAVLHRNFRLPKAKARHIFSTFVPQYVKEARFPTVGHHTDGCTRVVNGKILAVPGVIARSPHGRIGIMFGPVITTEAHPAFSGARTHANNTAEMTAMIEALSFLGLRGPVTRDEQSRIYL